MNQNDQPQMAQAQGEIGGPMNVTDNVPQRRDDIKLLPAQLNVGIIYAVVEYGTHMKAFANQTPSEQNQVYIGFEHPQMKQLFYMNDTVPRSSTSRLETTLSVADKANLRKLIHTVEGVQMDYNQAKQYNLQKLLGKILQINITHKQSKKTPGKFYEKVDGFFPLGNTPIPVPFEPELETLYFFIDRDANGNVIGNNFLTTNFAKLPSYMRNIIMNSKEGKEYAARGGKFAEQMQSTQNQNRSAAPPAGNDPVEMIATDYSYAQYIASGWTNEQLIAQGKARAKAAAPAPQQQAPPPQMQQAPAPQMQQQEPQVVPVAQQTGNVVMLDRQFSYAQYIQSGWTEQTLVNSGKARWATDPQAPPQQSPGPAAQQPQMQSAPGPQQAQPQQPQQFTQQPQNNNFLQEDPDDLPF